MEEAIGHRAASGSRDRAASDAEDRAAGGGALLPRIESPADLRRLDADALEQLCGEIREFIVEVVSRKGGHLGASLGVVELTTALLRVMDLPRDRIVWDTGHQAYVHKVLTGRREALWTIRQHGGISGFLRREESEYDAFGAGHASTAISAALGLATARDLARRDYRVVAVLGDGAMTGGLAYEALNNAGQSGRNLTVVLNDNGMSISPNVGAIAHYLTSVTANPHLKKLRDDALHLIRRLPAFGEPMGTVARKLEQAIKSAMVPGGLFQALGFSYYGPVDGHDLPLLLDLLPKVLAMDGPVLLHVLTRKGKGLPAAEEDDEGFHGVKPFDKTTGKALRTESGRPSYTEIFGTTIEEAAEAFPRMVAITAAMPSGTGLHRFRTSHPDRFFDVGIAEGHAVCFAAGLACDGARPVVAVYSTFLQRAFDQIVHDVALQKLPVVFAVDRAGLVGADGPTHHGVLDLSYLRCVPGMVVAAPKDGNELRDLLWTALSQDRAPFAFRYPRDVVPEGYDRDREPRVLRVGSWETLGEGDDIGILAVGTMVPVALEVRRRLSGRGVSATVVNCRFVKPMDRALLADLRRRVSLWVTVEESNLPGGFGEGVARELEEMGQPPDRLVRCGLPDAFVAHGNRGELLEEVGLTPAALEETILRALRGSAA